MTTYIFNAARKKRAPAYSSDSENMRTKSRRRAAIIAKNAKYALLFVILTAFSAALIARPEKYVSACAEGIALWAQCVLPSLFPFMVICAIMVNTGLTEKLSSPLKKVCGAVKLPQAAAICFLMSATSGYPAGSRTVSQFYSSGACTQEGCKKLAFLCSTSGPLFMTGTVGAGMFGDGAAGAKLFAAHIISVAAVAIFISLAGKRCESSIPPSCRENNVLYESFYGSVSAALTAGAFIAFFYTAAEIAHDFYILYPIERFLSIFTGENIAKAVASGLVEMTGGCAQLAACGEDLALPFAGFLITFGGACVLSQQLSYLTKCGVGSLKFILVKFIQAAACFIILLFL